MFEGRIATYEEFRVTLSLSSSRSVTGILFGITSAGGAATMACGFTPDYIDYATGVEMRLESWGTGDGAYEDTGYRLIIPALGYDVERHDPFFSPEAEMVLRFLGQRLTAEATGTWALEIDRVICTMGSYTLDEAVSAVFRSGMPLTPCSVPIFGTPFEVTATGLSDSLWGDPIYEPGHPPTGGGSVSGAGAATGKVEAFVGGTAVASASGSAFGRYSTDGVEESGENRAGLCVPSFAPRVVRMEAGYMALVFRGGFPKADKYDFTVDNSRPSNGSGRDDVRSDVWTVGTPAHTQFLGLVGDGRHVIEDPMLFSVPRPVYSTAFLHRANSSTVDYHDEGSAFPTRIEQGAILPYLSHAANFPAWCNAWYNPHWSYVMWMPPDAASSGVGWRAFGSVQDPGDHWLPARQQVSHHSALPSEDRTEEHVDVLTEPLGQNGLAGLMQGQVFGQITSYWGIADFKPLPLNPPAVATWPQASHAAWSVETGGPGLAFAATGVEVDGPGKVYLRLGSWDEAPAMLPRLARRIVLAYGLPTGWGVSATLEGLDGEELALGSSPGTYDLGRVTARKRTGTWKEDFAQFPNSDLGVSEPPPSTDASFRMAGDAEAALCSLSPAAGAWWRVRFDVTAPSDRAGQRATIRYPQALTDEPTHLARESGQWATLLSADAPPTRFSGLYWDPLTDALLNEPLVPGAGCPTAWDALAWRSSVGRGVPALTDPAALARESGLIEGREWISPKHLARDPFTQAQVTTAFVARGAQDEPIPCVVNSYRCVPPLVMFPRPTRTRADGWEAGAGYGMESYSLCRPTRSVVSVASTPPTISPPSGRSWISDSAATMPRGWAAREYRVATDGDEEADWALRAGSATLARARPYRGFLLLGGAAAIRKLLAYAVSRNLRHARAVDRGGLALDAAPNLRPFPWTEGAGLAEAEWATLAFPTQGRNDDPLVLYGPRGGTATLARVVGEGESLMPEFTTGAADYGAHCFAPNGDLYVFRLSGGTAYGRLYDALLSPVGPEWATTLSGLDDAPIQASCSVGSGGESRVHLQHFVSGDLVFATSPDGKDFF